MLGDLIDFYADSQIEEEEDESQREEMKKYIEFSRLTIKHEPNLTLLEQINNRKKEDNIKRKKKLLKQLHEKKTINLEQFLTRGKIYEQKKNFRLEQERFKKREKEIEISQQKPFLSLRTLQICKTLANKDPIYKRTTQIQTDKKENLENLRRIFTEQNELKRSRNDLKHKNKSCTTIHKSAVNSFFLEEDKKNFIKMGFLSNMSNNKKNENKSGIKINKKKYNYRSKSVKHSDENSLINKEIFIYNKKENIKKREYTNLLEKNSEPTFRPLISKGSLKILKNKNEINLENDAYYKYNTETNAKTMKNRKHISYSQEKNIFDKLYEDYYNVGLRKQFLYEHSLPSFKPTLNDNKNKSIRAKVYDNYLTESINKKASRSIEKMQKKYEVKNQKKIKHIKSRSIDSLQCKNNRQPKIHWRDNLSKLQPKKLIDKSYHLNIMDGGAWNGNIENNIRFSSNYNNIEIVKDFI